MQLVSASVLKNIVFPECASRCKLVKLLGVCECESACPWKFDAEQQPAIEDLGWGNGWEAEPLVVTQCFWWGHHPQERRIRKGSEMFEVTCEKCGYKYRFNAGD